jgi:FtsH-binding integral membrane protein
VKPPILLQQGATEGNLPNKGYWLAPERRAATDAFFEKYFAWYACTLLLTEVLAMSLAIQANLSAPPQMATGLVLFLVFGFIILNLVFAVQLFRRFLKKT